MANLYYTIIRIVEKPGKGRLELHNSTNKKDLTTGRPDKMARSIDYYDRASLSRAGQVLQDWRDELENRFSAIEVEAKKLVWGPK